MTTSRTAVAYNSRIHPRRLHARTQRAVSLFIIVTLALLMQACSDAGSPPTSVQAFPVITSVVPYSASEQDTITVTGLNFGSDQSAGAIRIGGIAALNIIHWTSTEIRMTVPAGARSSPIVVTVNGSPSNGWQYTIKGAQQARLSFTLEVQPILLNNCALSGCHNAASLAGNFNVSTYAGVRAGGFTYGVSVIIPGDSAGSAMMKMIRSSDNLIGLRMPLAGPYKNSGLPDSLIVKIGRWIAEGALNN